MSNHDELIAQFVEVSGSDENVAKFFLSSSHWSLEQALSNFCSPPSDNERPESEEIENGAMERRADASKKEEFQKVSSQKPRFATLNDMSKRDDNEEEGQAFYAGGSDRSGQQVLGPPKRKNFREQLSEMFRMAQEQNSGSETTAALGPSTSTGASGGGVTWGQGVRLGMTDNDHSVVGAAERNKRDAKRPVVVLKLWSQGFSVDDGELRQYDDPQNKEFLETIMRGEIPNELLEMGWMVNVDVEDHRHEEYKKAPAKQNFKGSGHTLGSPTPNISSDADVSSEPSASNTTSKEPAPSDNDKGAKQKLNVNTSEPVTTIQIRLADGSRITAQFNMTHTVADIQQYIRDARPQYAQSNFILVSSFPTRELAECDVTIEKAGLKNASIMQRIK